MGLHLFEQLEIDRDNRMVGKATPLRSSGTPEHGCD
jgi:hypothetical protein